jgi:ABC-type multidrug transport system ATPase subunit
MSEPILETRNLSKTFAEEPIVSGMNMIVEKGSVYGFLGLNSAGKTTTMKMLLGLLKPTSGEISDIGKNIFASRWEIFGNVGSMIEAPCAYPNLTADENMRFVTTLLDLPKNRIGECLKVVGLTAEAAKK